MIITKRLQQSFISLALLALTTISAAEEPATSNDWQWGANVYLWGAGINGTSVTGEDISIGFDTIIKNLDMSFMGGINARKGKWSLLTDVIYLSVSNDIDGRVSLPERPEIRVGADLKLKGWIVTPAVAYTMLETEAASVDLLAGARYLRLKADLSLNVDASLTSGGSAISESGHVWDGIVGVRGRLNLAPQWYLAYLLDVGAGDSALTWQALVDVNYKFNNVDAVLGYRHLDWDFDDSKVFDDLNFSGPFLGARFRF